MFDSDLLPGTVDREIDGPRLEERRVSEDGVAELLAEVVIMRDDEATVC